MYLYERRHRARRKLRRAETVVHKEAQRTRCKFMYLYHTILRHSNQSTRTPATTLKYLVYLDRSVDLQREEPACEEADRT